MFLVQLALIAALRPTYAVLIGVAVVTLQFLALLALVMGDGSGTHKLIWTAVILFLPLIGVILYLACGKSESDRPLLD